MEKVYLLKKDLIDLLDLGSCVETVGNEKITLIFEKNKLTGKVKNENGYEATYTVPTEYNGHFYEITIDPLKIYENTEFSDCPSVTLVGLINIVFVNFLAKDTMLTND